MNSLIEFLLGAKITVADKYTSFFNVVFYAVLSPMFVVFILFYSKETSLLSPKLWQLMGWKYLITSLLGSFGIFLALHKNIRLLKFALVLAMMINVGVVLFIAFMEFTKISTVMISAYIVLSFFLFQEIAETINLYCRGVDSSRWALDVGCYIQEIGKAKILKVSRSFIQCKLLNPPTDFVLFKGLGLRCQTGVGSRELFFDVQLESFSKDLAVVGFRIVGDQENDWSSFYEVIETMGGVE